MLSTGLESEFTECAIPDDEGGKFFPEALDIESSEDSIEGNGSMSLSRLRGPSNGGGVRDLCSGEAVYEWGGNWRFRGGRPWTDWNAGGRDDRFFDPGADVTLAKSGAIVGDRPAWINVRFIFRCIYSDCAKWDSLRSMVHHPLRLPRSLLRSDPPSVCLAPMLQFVVQRKELYGRRDSGADQTP